MKNCIDFFCGAGGASHGLESSHHVRVVAAVNHDPDAIACHQKNHPHTRHYNHDIREIDAELLAQLHTDTSLFWWSAECTHQSNAKGGAPRDADSRMLNMELIRFIDAFEELEYILIENVPEFESWGPLIQATTERDGKKFLDRKGCFVDKNGLCWKDPEHTEPYLIPDKAQKGAMHFRWIRLIEARGFRYEYRLLNCADFGARTSRNRYYGIAAKKGLPIRWPRQTHTKNPPINTSTNSLINLPPLKKHKPVRDILDLTNTGKSIFNRKIPLSPKTIARIEYGLNKFFPAENGEPYVLRYPNPDEDISQIPEGKICAGNEPCEFIVKQYSQKYHSQSVDQPMHTITTQPRSQLMHCFLAKYYGNSKANSIDKPVGTITTKDRFGLLQCELAHASLTPDSSPLTTFPMILPYNYGNNPRSVENPIGTICAKRDKYLCQIKTESPSTSDRSYRLISGLIVDNRILDIHMRMLSVPELLAAQGFPPDYKMPRSATKAKKFIGNSVPPNMVELLTHAQFGTEWQRIGGVRENVLVGLEES